MRIPRLRFTIRLPDDRGRGRFPDPSPTGLSLAALPIAHGDASSKEVDYVRQAHGAERDRTGWCAGQATIAKLQSASVRGSTWERLGTLSGAMAHDLRRLAFRESRLKAHVQCAPPAIAWLPVEPDPPEQLSSDEP